MQKNKLTLVLAHCMGWFFFALLPVIFLSGGREADLFNAGFLLRLISFLAVFIVLFYTVYGIAVPQFLLKKKYLYFGLVLALLLVAVYILHPFDDLMRFYGNRPPENGPKRPPPRGSHFDIISIALFLMVSTLAIALRLNAEWKQESEKASRAEAGKAQAELSFLKAQIHPHFLFNTLNNIYAMAVIQHNNTADSILKLSNIMRYVTEEINTRKVPLTAEIDFIQDYIDLQKLRTGDKCEIQFLLNGDTGQYQIAPLIFMSFIENAFKYGISKHETGVIRISLEAIDGKVYFHCSNKVFSQENDLANTGIGISNTKQRLELIYPGQYTLNIQEESGRFMVDLCIPSKIN